MSELGEVDDNSLPSFVRNSMVRLVKREILNKFSWSGFSRENKEGIAVPKETFKNLVGIVSLLRGTLYIYEPLSVFQGCKNILGIYFEFLGSAVKVFSGDRISSRDVDTKIIRALQNMASRHENEPRKAKYPKVITKKKITSIIETAAAEDSEFD